MRARGIIGLGLLAGMGAFFLNAAPPPPPTPPPRPRSKREHQNANHTRGTVRDRGLKRIQGRQDAR